MWSQEKMEEALSEVCLRDTTHDWRRLHLVNRSMSALYRQWMKAEMEAEREKLLQQLKEAQALAAQTEEEAVRKLVLPELTRPR